MTSRFKVALTSLFMPLFIGIISLWLKSLRVKCKNEEALQSLKNSQSGYVLTFWHANLLVGYHHHRGDEMASLVSLSRDGGLLTQALKAWGYDVIRGSRHHKKDEALNALHTLATQGRRLALTPDGSRGPARKLKAGAVIVARDHGLPLIAAGIAHSHCRKLKTWDSFRLPMPFSRVVIVYSDPLFIESGLDHKETQAAILKAEDQLNFVNDRAETCVTST